jgi:inner membrane protein
MKNTMFFKLMTLAGISVLLYIFLLLIQGVIWERQSYRTQAINSIASSTGGPQTILGPLVYASCVETWVIPPAPKKKDEDLAAPTEGRRDFMLTAAANNLQIKANVAIEPRARGIHQTNIHNTKALLTATWDNLNSLNPQAQRKDSRVQCDAPVMMFGVSDPQGIRHAALKLNTQTVKLSAGTLHSSYKNGLHAKLSDALRQGGQSLNAEIEFEVAGIERISVVPFAENTTLRMQSNWAHPSFGGRFSPVQRTVNSQGFDASWRVSALASNATLGVAQGVPLCQGNDESTASQDQCVGVIQVSFIQPINAYSLSDRASKYGLLFVVLTFVAVGLFEVMKKLRVHPVQYLLAGAAICTFFLLLVSLSEHIGFARAYAAGASATVLLLTYYASYMLGGKWRGLPFGAGIALLYPISGS